MLKQLVRRILPRSLLAKIRKIRAGCRKTRPPYLDPGCLQFCLTAEERRHFQEQGYLVVPRALDSVMLARLISAVDRIDARERHAHFGLEKTLSFGNLLPEDKAFLDLIDWAPIFPKVWGILGWNIHVYHTHLEVTPPVRAAGSRQVHWHQDNARVNEEMEVHPRPRLSLKAGYFLTDLSGANWGNVLLVPGSQLRDELDCPHDFVCSPPGSVPLCVPAGAALIFDRRLWHSRSPNLGPHTRKVVWIGYSYRWLRSRDSVTVPQKSLLHQTEPIRQQLLGHANSATSFYDPADADVPLRVWLREHCPGDARWSTHHEKLQAQKYWQ